MTLAFLATLSGVAVLALLLSPALAVPNPSQQDKDRFNYGDDSDGNNYGQDEWDKVKCHNIDTCPGWPTNWEHFHSYIPYKGTNNMCRDCSVNDKGWCKRHKQSPIQLQTNTTTARRECNDRHRMNYVQGNCRLGGFRYEILPHVLRAYQPEHCGVAPNIDFSMGFPRPWLLEFTDISVPSQHVMNGKRYDAEVVLSHTYSARKPDRLIGNVAILLEKGNETDFYDYLEVFIRRWKVEAQTIRRECKLRNNRPIKSPSPQQRARRKRADIIAKRTTPKMPTPRVKRRYFDREFQPYDWYKKADTEYYFRYEGSTPEPPCFETVHWRVLKNPIRVAPKQINDLDRLIAERIDPLTCKHETAGKPRRPGSKRVDVNRRIQKITKSHNLVFCECQDWKSASKSDRAWCEKPPTDRGVLPYSYGRPGLGGPN